MMKPTGRSQQISQPIADSRQLSEESNEWFWNPGRVGIQREPEWFRKLLDEAGHTEIALTWNRWTERWQVFARVPKIATPLCQGWRYLFPVQLRNGSYAPLDERTIAKIFLVDGSHQGNGKRYFERIAAEMQRDKERAEQADQTGTHDAAGEFFDYTLPKVGYGAISSSKVVGQ